MAVVHMATFLVGYWAPLFRVFLCKPKEIQLPGNKEARLSEKFWFRIKTCENIVSEANLFGFQARCILKRECWPNIFRQSLSKTFLEHFWFRFKTYGGVILDLVRDFLGNFVLESKPFLRDFGTKARHFVRAIRIGRNAFISTISECHFTFTFFYI